MHTPRLPVPLPEFDIRGDFLVRSTYLTAKHEPDCEITQIVVFKSLVQAIIQNLHCSPHARHQGKDRYLHQARIEYYWPTILKDIHIFIDTCQYCAENKSFLKSQVPIPSYPVPQEPWDTIATDLLKLPLNSEVHQYFHDLKALTLFSIMKGETKSKCGNVLRGQSRPLRPREAPGPSA